LRERPCDSRGKSSRERTRLGIIVGAARAPNVRHRARHAHGRPARWRNACACDVLQRGPGAIRALARLNVELRN
jgi:hypothetical protein